MTAVLLVAWGSIIVGALYAGLDRVLEHRERLAGLSSGNLYDGETVVLAMRAAAYRAADPAMGEELIERIVETVAQDLDAGVLTDPRPPADAQA